MLLPTFALQLQGTADEPSGKLTQSKAVFHWFGNLNRFSTKMGTEGERVKEEVEQRRRKGTVPGHNSQTLGHLNCTQWVQFGI